MQKADTEQENRRAYLELVVEGNSTRRRSQDNRPGHRIAARLRSGTSIRQHIESLGKPPVLLLAAAAAVLFLMQQPMFCSVCLLLKEVLISFNDGGQTNKQATPTLNNDNVKVLFLAGHMRSFLTGFLLSCEWPEIKETYSKRVA